MKFFFIALLYCSQTVARSLRLHRRNTPHSPQQPQLPQPPQSPQSSHRRYRRSMGIKSQCFPRLQKRCKVFKYGAMKKKFCVMGRIYVCKALDWMLVSPFEHSNIIRTPFEHHSNTFARPYYIWHLLITSFDFWIPKTFSRKGFYINIITRNLEILVKTSPN